MSVQNVKTLQLAPAWYLGEALQAFARNLKEAKTGFTRGDLNRWSERIATEGASSQAPLNHLKMLGMITRVATPAGKPRLPQGVHYFALTTVGEEAAKAAVVQANHDARASSARAVGTQNAGSPFAARLWALLRARRVLCAVEAANVLLDVCDEATFERGRVLAGRWLLTWSRNHPEHVQLSKGRIEGALRYVLVQDLGVSPPQARLRPPPSSRPAEAAVA